METRPSSLFYHILLISFIVVIISIAFVPVALADQMGDMSGDHEIARGTTSSGETFYYVSNEVIVRYRPQLYNNTVLYQALSSEIARQINGSVSEDYGSMGLPGMQLIALSNGTTPERALAYYQNISYIEYAQYNYVEALPEPQPLDPGCKQPLMGSFLGGNLANYPNDPYFSQQWYLKKIDAPYAWTISTGSPDVEIAVLDSGIDINHPDLASNIDRARASSTVRDSHGTACAGVLAARGNNGIGITGVMWQARIVPIVVEDSNGYILSSYVISGLYQSHTYGAKIVSCSFGFLHNDLAMQDAFANSDALVICAAGNSGINDDIYPIYPAVYNLDNIISVAGTDQNDNLATFPGEGSSNYGVRTVDLAAPGIPILTTSTGNTYNEWQGTSFSAPMVAGVAGLIMSRHPGIGNAQVKAAILNNVDKIPSLKGKVVTGGRLNASKALKSLEPVTPTPTPTPAITPTPTKTQTPTLTPTPTATPTQTPTVTPTISPTPTQTVSPTPTVTVTTKPTPTMTPVPNTPPVSSFTASVTRGGAPLTVTFTDQSSNYPSRWMWDFGDGVSSTDRNPVHTYTRTGIYDVRLSVYNALGGNGLTKWNYISVSGSGTLVPTPTLTPTPTPTTTQTVTPTPSQTVVPTTVITTLPTTVPTTVVTTSPVPTMTPVPKTPPISSFTASVTRGGAPLAVTFTDQSPNYPSRWLWDFGDGTSSTEKNPVHIYAKPGLYSVKLSVFNALGGNGLTKWNYISVTGHS